MSVQRTQPRGQFEETPNSTEIKPNKRNERIKGRDRRDRKRDKREESEKKKYLSKAKNRSCRTRRIFRAKSDNVREEQPETANVHVTTRTRNDKVR